MIRFAKTPGIFFIIAIALYAVCLRGAFFFDDYRSIVNNQWIRVLWPLNQLWNDDPSRFLPKLTFALNFAAGGLNPIGYHLVNIVIHALNAWLVFLVILQLMMTLPGRKVSARALAFGTALIFLTHPVQTQSVAYIVQRSNELMTAAFLLSVFTFLKFRMAKNARHQAAWYCLSLVSAMAGAYCKPNIIVLPIMLFVIQAVFFSRNSKPSLKEAAVIVPFFSVIVLVALNLWILITRGGGLVTVSGITHQTAAFSRLQYFSTECNVIMQYLFVLCCPFQLNFEYDFPVSGHIGEFPAWLSLAAILALSFFAVRWRKQNKMVSFGILWFLLALVPESSVFPLGDVINEHRLYLPMIGFAVILSEAVQRMAHRKAGIFIMTIVVGGLSVLTVMRNTLWASPIRIFEDAVRKSPLKLRPLYQLEAMYSMQGRYREAEAVLERAYQIAPGYPATHCKIGLSLLRRGEYRQAYAHFVKGMAAEQPEVSAWSAWHAGRLAKKYGDDQSAERFLKYSAARDPRDEWPCIDLGNLYAVKGRYAQAKEMYMRAIQIAPYNPYGYNGLGAIFMREGKVDEGIQFLQKGLALRPDDSVLLSNLARAYRIKTDGHQ